MSGRRARVHRSCWTLVLTAILAPSGAGVLSAQEVPYLGSRVNDLAALIPESEEEALEAQLEAFELETGSQVVVLTVPDLGGRSVEEYATEVAETWNLGREGVDDGVLFLVARDDRKLRIEVGYGVEGSLTDAESRRILDWIVVPAFRDGDFSRGISEATAAVLDELRGTTPAPDGPPAWQTEDQAAQRAADRRSTWVSLAVLAFFVFLFLRMGRRRGRRRRAWSSRTGWGRPPIIIPTHPQGRRERTKRRSRSRKKARPRPPSRPRRQSRTRSSSRSRGFGGSFRGGGGRFGGGGASSGW